MLRNKSLIISQSKEQSIFQKHNFEKINRDRKSKSVRNISHIKLYSIELVMHVQSWCLVENVVS